MTYDFTMVMTFGTHRHPFFLLSAFKAREPFTRSDPCVDFTISKSANPESAGLLLASPQQRTRKRPERLAQKESTRDVGAVLEPPFQVKLNDA
jgi:hypothetical protein